MGSTPEGLNMFDLPDDPEDKVAYAQLTKNSMTSTWWICTCHRCPYAFADSDKSGETSVHWKSLRAARSAFSPSEVQ